MRLKRATSESFPLVSRRDSPVPFSKKRSALLGFSVLLASPTVSGCGNFLNSDPPLITDSPILPTVTVTQTITEAAPNATGMNPHATGVPAGRGWQAGVYSMYQEPIVQAGRFYLDFTQNGVNSKGDPLSAGATIMASCIEYDSAYTHTSTRGLWYKVADGEPHAGQFVPTNLGYNGPHGEHYDPAVPTCDPNVTLPPVK
ncbi:MAG TPA: hypothetical protein VJR27_03030 [Candidatus Saccharimonadales bacterium]|nr:hypothetical protein [Candidatus Saccharimonadales bacterium]